jgi:mono/diheme cytochrome c family protein
MKRLALVLALAAPLAASAEDGLTVYFTRCSSCHGPEGRGKATFAIPVLVGSSLSAADMEKVIADGRAKMPSFKTKLTPDEIRGVAAFVKGGFKR